MASEYTLIRNRRREVEQEIVVLRQTIAASETELTELEMAERVIARLTGVLNVVSNSSSATGPTPASSGAAREKKQPLPEMILTILRDKLAEGIVGIEPKNATPIIRDRWQPDISGTYVSTTFWRMMKGGLLEKVEGTSTYRLPQKNEPTDTILDRASAGSLFDAPAKGREAGPGGGP